MWLGGSSGSGLWKNDGEIAGSLLFYFKDGGGCCLNVKLKKVLCVVLTLLLSVNTLFSCVVYADQGFDDLFISPTPTPEPTKKPLIEIDVDNLPNWEAQQDEMVKLNSWFMSLFAGSAPVMKEWGASAAQTMQELFNKLLASDEIKTDGDNLYITQNGVDQINDTVQDSVYRFDGYYLIEPSDYYSPTRIRLETRYTGELLELMNKTLNSVSTYVYYKGGNADSNKNTIYHIDFSKYYYIDTTYKNVYCFDKELNKWRAPIVQSFYNYSYTPKWQTRDNLSTNFFYNYKIDMAKIIQYSYGAPFKIFYSEQDVMNYILKGEQRTYAPKLPSQIIKIPTKVINNTPNITYNITTENKTENNVQNEYNKILYDYITNLYPSSGNPTPTPTPIISDGEPTPTPTPDWGDGSLTPTPVPGPDMTETNDWLKKIYELLEKFYNAYKEFTDKLSDYLDNNDAFFKKVSEYLEKYDGKLDQIIDALDKITQGKDEGDEKGCQYDYKELSEFLTKLWNDSDKKFDDMIDLLEENNEYQEKMLSTLNSIKNILRAQSVMDTFKNRSRETANKAKEKFPTSVPWDIAMIVNAMDAEPEDPVFLLPIKIERLGIDEEIKVDLSTGEWEKLAKACRYMLTLLFILFMIKLSMKLFSGKDDD